MKKLNVKGNKKEAQKETVMEMLMGKKSRDINNIMKESMDKETQNLALKVWINLSDKLTLKGRDKEAFNRLFQSIDAGKGLGSGMHRNNIFKAADALGIKLPNMMF